MATPEDFGGAPPAEPAEDVNAAFEAALRNEAAAAPAAIPAPPRATPSADPEAPHGRDDQNKPLAPYGINQKTGRPNIKAPGPGRGGKKDQPRTTSKAVAPRAAVAARDFRDDLAGMAEIIWMGGAMVPPARPYAQLFRQSSGPMVEAFNDWAQADASVAAYIEKFAGQGSWAPVIKVSVATAPFVVGCWQLARKEADPKRAAERDRVKAELATQCEQEFGDRFKQLVAAAEGEQAA